jgi:hypothetical protein
LTRKFEQKKNLQKTEKKKRKKQRKKKSGEKKEGEKKKKSENYYFFGKTCLFGKIQNFKKSKFYWKDPITNIFFLQFFIIYK